VASKNPGGKKKILLFIDPQSWQKDENVKIPLPIVQCSRNAALLACLLLSCGCVREISFGGIFIPAWLICSLIGITVGSIVSLKIEPHLVPEPGYFQMLLRFAIITIFFIISYMLFFVYF